jgi:hypothetical protein
VNAENIVNEMLDEASFAKLVAAGLTGAALLSHARAPDQVRNLGQRIFPAHHRQFQDPNEIPADERDMNDEQYIDKLAGNREDTAKAASPFTNYFLRSRSSTR